MHSQPSCHPRCARTKDKYQASYCTGDTVSVLYSSRTRLCNISCRLRCRIKEDGVTLREMTAVSCGCRGAEQWLIPLTLCLFILALWPWICKVWSIDSGSRKDLQCGHLKRSCVLEWIQSRWNCCSSCQAVWKWPAIKIDPYCSDYI